MHEPLFVLFALLAIVAIAEWLSRYRIGRSLGGALLAIVLGAVLANLGVIPSGTSSVPVYELTLSNAASLSIFLMLLEVRFSALRQAGGAMLGAFVLGACATMIGVVGAFHLTGVAESLGELSAPVGGMYVATYIGGSANFNALALHYDVPAQATLYAGANAVDNVVTTLWIIALLLIPAWIHRWRRTRANTPVSQVTAGALPQQTPIDLFSLATLLALALGGHGFSLWIAALAAEAGFALPAVLILTTLALTVAQLPGVHRLGGAQTLGTYGAYLFLAVIGAYCDFTALVGMGMLGLHLLLFVALAVLIHGVLIFGIGSLLRLEPELLAVASCANIGGATTALPIARGLSRMDLLLPGILAGTLGTALGTYAGFAAVWLLR